MQLLVGRPEDTSGRSEKEIKVYDLLDKLAMWYQRIDHVPADTMEVCNEIDKVLGASTCKNLFLCNRKKTKFYLLMMPGDKVFKTKELSGQHGIQRLSFASEEDMEKLLNITPGSVSVMGLMNDKNNDVQLLVDEDVLEGDYLGCHPCMNTSSLKLRTKEVFDVFLTHVKHEALIVHLKGNMKD